MYILGHHIVISYGFSAGQSAAARRRTAIKQRQSNEPVSRARAVIIIRELIDKRLLHPAQRTRPIVQVYQR